MLDLGPQYAGDDAFTARMRRHQSWYRAAKLGLPCGVGPGARDVARYGNMLEAEDGARGVNFLSPAIAALAMARQKENPGGIKAHRLLCNMLSSQPMCFNLIAPIALDRALGRELLSAMLGGRGVARIHEVIFEHAPAPKQDYLDDATSFDAFIDFDDASGARGFVAIETKLTEPFSKVRYRIAERPAYLRWVEADGAPWKREAAPLLDGVRHNQLFRNHALAAALRGLRAETYAFGHSLVVHHDGDVKCRRALDGYLPLIAEGADVAMHVCTLGALSRAFRPIVKGTAFEGWLAAFDERYVSLEGSEASAPP